MAQADLEGETPSAAYERFVAVEGARLRRALVARYGIELGAEIANDALTRAWADWERVRAMANPTSERFSSKPG